MPTGQTLKPRSLTYRGTIEASALFFDPVLIGEAKARRRVLELWQPGARVYEIAGGYLLSWPEARRLRCEQAPGLPLVKEGELFLAMPLTSGERKALDAPPGAAVLARGDGLEVFPLSGLPLVDVAMWIDVTRFETMPLQSLGEAPPLPALVMEEVAIDLRQSLAIEAAPEQMAFLAALRGEELPNISGIRTQLLAFQEFLQHWLRRLNKRRDATEPSVPEPSSLLTGKPGKTLLRYGIAVLVLLMGVVWLSALASTPHAFLRVLTGFFVILALISIARAALPAWRHRRAAGQSAGLEEKFVPLWILAALVLCALLAAGVHGAASDSFIASTAYIALWIVAVSYLLSKLGQRWSLGQANYTSPPRVSIGPNIAAVLVFVLIAVAFGAAVAFGTQAMSGNFTVWLKALAVMLTRLVVGGLILYGLILILSGVWSGLRRGGTKPKTSVSVSPSPLPSSNGLTRSGTIAGFAFFLLLSAASRGNILGVFVGTVAMVAASTYEFRRAKRMPQQTQPSEPAPLPAPPKAVSGPLSAWRNRLARLAWMAGLWRVYGPQQARYIIRMMEMFERGQLDSALRHAIPIDSLPGTAGAAAPAFGVPKPRSLLDIFTGQRAGGAGIPLPPEVLNQLRQQYRKAHEQLDSRGRHEEAAFVLAELLQASSEAVAYLERHGRLRLAAELAEGRKLPPDMVVRQWLIAGNRERALWFARRSGAFAAAIARLERGSEADRENAKGLRLLWANDLARSGNFVAAVETAWPLAEARALAQEWITRGLALGGLMAARMLARQVQLAPTLDDELRERVLDLLEDSDAERAPARLEFAQRLAEGDTRPVVQTVSRAAARALAHDAGCDDFNETRRATCEKLINLSGDGALRADLPLRLFVTTGNPLSKRHQILELQVEAADTGAMPVLDAAYLPDGRCIVALGEAGARLLSRQGHTVAHFDQPCHRLVVSDQGDRAIALAPRGDAMRLARLDFPVRRATSWCETRLQKWALSYDGSLWFTAAGGQFFAIDATAPDFGALWHTPDAGAIAFIDRSSTSCSFVTSLRNDTDAWGRPLSTMEQTDARWERWQFELPVLTLRQRSKIQIVDETSYSAPQQPVQPVLTVGSDGEWANLTSDSSGAVWLFVSGASALALVDSSKEEKPLALTASPRWWVALTHSAAGVCCYLVDRQQKQVRARLQFKGAQTATARLSETHLTLCDDLGRLLVFDLERGGVIRNSRIS